MLTHAEEKWLCKHSSKTSLKKWKPMGICKLQTKNYEETSTPRLRQLTIFILPQSIHMRVRTTQRENVRYIKIIAIVTS